jgi:flagellum-specific ATP synthase
MLSRQLAHEGHFPAIDVLQSVSRLAAELTGPEERALVAEAVDVLATYERNRQMVEMGAYKGGSHAALDRALDVFPQLRDVLRQAMRGPAARADALAALGRALGRPA